MGFYDCVTKLCKEKKISLAALAREVGLSNSATTYWKHGSVPKYETMKKIADYFGVTVEELLDIDKEYLDNYVDDYVDNYASKEGIDKKEFKKRVIEQEIEEYPIDFYLNIVENAEKAVVKNYENITDKQLRSRYIECFRYLNRLGRIEAVKRMEEFIETDKYCKRHEKG